MKKNKKSKPFGFVKDILIFILFVGVIITAITVKNGYDMYKKAINDTSITERVQEIKDMKYYVKISDIPISYKNAVIAIEDNRFYEHGPFDIVSLGRAVITNIKDMSLTEGGSTITQQLAKNMYFSQEKRFSRKVAEVFVAFDLEKKYNKDEILEYYMNIIYYGDGYIGIGQASMGYFDKTPNELTFDEQTLLAGLPNAPSAYALTSNPDLALQRQQMVIDAMKKYNYVD
ncbi:MAG: transglycosylase domain-containing protein [Clostridia bacterium]|nr:transglycosylase domain-containing protein [Clostridia bacterium]